MSKPMLTKEDAINQLYSTIKTKFEEDGVLKEVRCLLQAKMVAMMRGHQTDSKTFVPRTMDGGDIDTDARINVLNQLIMEYLHWHGFHYTAEMFTLESGSDHGRPLRQYLEGVLGNFQHANVPILLQLIADIMAKETKPLKSSNGDSDGSNGKQSMQNTNRSQPQPQPHP